MCFHLRVSPEFVQGHHGGRTTFLVLFDMWLLCHTPALTSPEEAVVFVYRLASAAGAEGRVLPLLLKADRLLYRLLGVSTCIMSININTKGHAS